MNRYGLWIPPELVESDALSITEKWMAGEIEALDNPEHGCTATNEHFQNRTKLGLSRIKEIIARLVTVGVVTYENPAGNRRVLRSRLAQWTAARKMEAERAAAAFEAEVAEAERALNEPEQRGPENRPVSECHRPENRPEGAGIPAPHPPDTTEKKNTLNTQGLYGGVSPNSEIGPALPVTRNPQAPRRRGRPPRTGVGKPRAVMGPDGQPLPTGPDDDTIYAAYPRKIKRPQAIKSIHKAIARLTVQFRGQGVGNPETAAREFLLTQTRKYSEYRERVISGEPDAAQFTPHPATWFNNEGYNDEHEWNGGSGGNGTGGGRPRGGGPRRPLTPAERGQFAESEDYSGVIYRPGSGGGAAGSGEDGNGHGGGAGTGGNGRAAQAFADW